MRVLRGEFANAAEYLDGSYVVDARALTRWNLDQARLPPDTELLFAPTSLWKLYQGWIVTLLVLVAVQFALIVTLLIQSIIGAGTGLCWPKPHTDSGSRESLARSAFGNGISRRTN